MTDEHLKSAAAQTLLKEQGHFPYPADGDWDTRSKAAARSWLAKNLLKITARLTPAKRYLLKSAPSNATLRTLAAQIYLADLKFYQGLIDNVWGPLSAAAARAWADAANTAEFNTPYDVAKHYVGVKEIPGKAHNGVILNWYRRLVISIWDDETPWCSTFVNFCALEAGYERTGKLNARSWLDIGERIARPEDAREGDVIIFERGSSGWEGHVAFLVSLDQARGIARCLGGNQADAVNVSTYPLYKLLGIRRLRSLELLQGDSNKI